MDGFLGSKLVKGLVGIELAIILYFDLVRTTAECLTDTFTIL